jgi:hypothetical protein
MDWEPVTEHMNAHRGVFPIRRLATESDQRVFRQIAARLHWEWPFPGVAMAPGHDDERRRLTAVLEWVGGEAALTGWSGLWNLGLTPNLPSRVHVVVGHSRRNRRGPDHRVTRTRHPELIEAEEVHGLRTACPEWVITDMASIVRQPVLRGHIIDARQRRLLDLDRLWDLTERRGRFPGRGDLWVCRRELDPEVCDSELEYRIRRRVADEPTLPTPDPEPVEVALRDGRSVHVDVGWTPQLVGIECLGMGAHSARSQLDADAVRDNAIVADTDWRIFRATWSHLTNEVAWRHLVEQLNRALTASAPAAGARQVG